MRGLLIGGLTLIVPGIKTARVSVKAFPLFRRWSYTSDDTTHYSTLNPGLEGHEAKVKLCEKNHVAPHITGKTWIFSMKSIWGAKLHRRIASWKRGIIKLHGQTKITEIEILGA